MTKVTRALLTVCLGGFLAVGCGGSSNSSGSSSLAKKLMMCNMQSGSSSGVTCTGTEQYSSCVESKCATQYKKCYGDAYQSGTPGGLCSAYLDCVGKAADPCKSGCTPSSECQSCQISDIVSCTQSAGCALPMCTVTTGGSGTGTGTGSGGRSGGTGGSTTGGAGTAAAGTCKDVTACCAKISDANTKMACQQVASSGNDQICSAALPSLKSLCP